MKRQFVTSVAPLGATENIREGMKVLSYLIQPGLTWLTGKPGYGEKPLIKRTGVSHLLTAYLFLFSGTLLSGIATLHFEPVYIPIGWLLTVSGARKLMTTINHYCVHKDMLPDRVRKSHPQLHQVIADINSAMFSLQSFDKYWDDHHTHHRPDTVGSVNDPDMAFMLKLGFKPGVPKAKLWRKLFFNLFFPLSTLHRLFLLARIRVFAKEMNKARLITTIVLLTILTGCVFLISWKVVLIAWIIPITFLYHIAALLQFSSEHVWLFETSSNGKLDQNIPNKVLVLRSQRITYGRFCGDKVPNNNLSLFASMVAWLKWWFRLIFYHLPVRLFVLPGDLVQHDWHHRSKFNADWPNAAFERAKMVSNLKAGDPPMQEIWGLFNVIDNVFSHLSTTPKFIIEAIDETDDIILGM